MMTWNLLRAAGIGSYVMLFASIAWGLFGTTTLWGRLASKVSATLIHQFFSTVGMLLLGAHLALLYVDPWMPFDARSLFVPMASEYRPLAIAMGIVAMYLAVVVIVTSWVRKGIGPKVWRAIHLSSIPMFCLMLLHGLLAGTDAQRPWMWSTYIVTGAAIVFLLFLRAFTARPARNAGAAPSRPARSAAVAVEVEVSEPSA